VHTDVVRHRSMRLQGTAITTATAAAPDNGTAAAAAAAAAAIRCAAVH
jgi:hypothetical protein